MRIEKNLASLITTFCFLYLTIIFLEDAITIVHLPAGPSAYFKLSSIQLTKEIHVCSLPSDSSNLISYFPIRDMHVLPLMRQN